MTSYLAEPSLQVIAPLIAVLVYAIWGKLTLIASAIIAAAMLFFANRGVELSCSIGESECIGATVFFYLILLMWLVVSVSLIGHALYKLSGRRR